MPEEMTLADVVAELQQTNAYLETLTEEVVSVKEYNWDVGNSIGICICLLFVVALFAVRNLILSFAKKGVKDV